MRQCDCERPGAIISSRRGSRCSKCDGVWVPPVLRDPCGKPVEGGGSCTLYERHQGACRVSARLGEIRKERGINV